LKNLYEELKDRNYNNWPVIDPIGKSQKIKGVDGHSWEFLISDDLRLFIEEKSKAAEEFSIAYKDNLLAKFKATFSVNHFI
jgi:hypothetical protein